MNVFDAGWPKQEDWRVKPNLLISGGLRYEGQNGHLQSWPISRRGLGLVWVPGGRRPKPRRLSSAQAAGFFTTASCSNLLQNATLLNGVNKTQYIIRDPSFFIPTISDVAMLAAPSTQQGGADTHGIYRDDPALHAPYMIKGAAGIERQLPHGISMAVNTNT